MSVPSLSRSSLVVGVVLSLFFTMQAWAASAPTKLIGGSLDQIIPAANGSFLGWSQNRTGKRSYDAWVQTLPVGSGTPVRLNPSGSRGYMGGIRADTNEAIYERVSSAGSDLWIVPDLTNPTAQTAAPARINSVRQEAFPSISNKFILFTRASNRYWSVLLYDRLADTLTRLARAPASCLCLISGQVSGRYVTWTKCSDVDHCNAHYLDTMTSTKGVFPNPSGRPLYGGTISAATGNMYAVRSGASCGRRVRVMRWHVGSATAPAVVASFPTGTDLVTRLFVYNDTVHDTVYFDPASCATALGDIYEVTSAET